MAGFATVRELALTWTVLRERLETAWRMRAPNESP